VYNGEISFGGVKPEPVLSKPGLEMAADYDVTSDRFVVVAEAESNAVSLWSLNASGDVSFVDRRTSGEDRLRFKGFLEPSTQMSLDPDTAQFRGQIRNVNSMAGVCGLQKFDVDGDRYVLSASGCDHIWENDNFLQNTSYLRDPEWDSVVGHWDFDSASLYNTEALGTMHVNQFDANLPNGLKQSVKCEGAFCTYRRDRITSSCLEKVAGQIGPATFRDKKNYLGAAVLVGSHVYCQADTDWDTPAEVGLSATNFIASADGIESLSVDALVNFGTFITDDIDELVDGNPATSKLPLSEMTAEILFSTGEGSASEHPLMSSSQTTRCANPTIPRNCGCQKGWRLDWMFGQVADKNGNRPIILSFKISVAENAKDATKFATIDPMDTNGNLKFGIGPGLGTLTNIRWTSPSNFVSPGDWIHLIAVYDGKYASIYVNGTLKHKEAVCEAFFCGNIIYAAAYHTCPGYCPCPPLPGGHRGETVPAGTACGSNTEFKACFQGDDAPPGRKTPVTIGILPNIGQPGVSTSHVGFIKHARLYKKAVSQEYVILRQKEFSMLQGKYPVAPDTYWYNSNGQSNPKYPSCDANPPQMSPDVTYIDTRRVRDSRLASDTVKVLGVFLSSNEYKARFTNRALKTPFELSAKYFDVPCSVNPSTASVLDEVSKGMGYTDSLFCQMPADFSYRYTSAVLSIMEKKKGQDKYNYVWSRACFRSECGFYESGSPLRKNFDTQWIIKSECCNVPAGAPCTGVWKVSNAVSGTVIRINLLTQSTLMQVDEVNENLQLRYSLTYGRTSYGLLSASKSRKGTFESLAYPFTNVPELAVLGASSISFIKSNDILYLLVANFWDGNSLVTHSSIIRMDSLQEGITTPIQSFETKGARKFHSFQIQNKTYVALASFAENSAFFRWQPGIPITHLFIADQGRGYIDGVITLVCNRPAQYCSGNGAFSAKFRVDGPAYGLPNGTVGRIVDVNNQIANSGEDYQADHDVILTYPPPLDNKTMDETITTVSFSEQTQIRCSRLVHALSLRPGFTSRNCVVDDSFAYSNADLMGGGFQARVSKVDVSGGNILAIAVDVAGLFAGNLDAPAVSLTTPGSTCECIQPGGAVSDWPSCLIAESNTTYPRFRIAGSPDAGGHGFRAAFELSRNGTVQRMQLKEHGESYSSLPKISVEVEMGFNVSWKESSWASGGCTCDLGAWDKCIHISRAHGSYACVGGENHGKLCVGESDAISCEGHQRGLCRAGKRARIYPPTHGLPERAGPIKYVQQDPDWTNIPGRSETVPMNLQSRVDLPVEAATDITSFTKDDVVYLAMSVYLDAGTEMLSTKSVLFKLREVGTTIQAEMYQSFNTRGAQAVNAWAMPWCEPTCVPGPGRAPVCISDCKDTTFVMFACETTSPLYRWDLGSKLLVHVQDVRTRGAATSLEPFVSNKVSYVVVTQVGSVSTMYRWNGTMLLSQTDGSTRQRDTAGGQNILTGSAEAALHFPIPSKADLLVFGNHLNGITPSLLYRARNENIRNLGTPLRVLSRVNPDTDESFVYVAAYGDLAIQVFQRASDDLFFNPQLSFLGRDGVLEGLGDISISGNKLYSVSSSSKGGTINIFVINQNGSLTIREDLGISAEGTTYGLRGVRSLHVGNEYIFTGSFVDQAVSVFKRINSGEQEGGLQYLEHVRNGERLVSRFHQYENDASSDSTPNSFLQGKFPSKAGQEGIGDTVTCVSHEFIGEKVLFAVAYMPDFLKCIATNCTNSSISEVYIYEYSFDHFIEFQSLDGPKNVSDFEFFRTMDINGVEWDFLVVVSAVGKPSVYRYDPVETRFVFFNELTFKLPDGSHLPPDCLEMGLCDSTERFYIPGIKEPLPPWQQYSNGTIISGRRAESFIINDVVYLAVAYWWPFANGHGWFSIIYRWQIYGATVLADGKEAKGIGFETFQIIPTEGALDVDTATWTFPCAETKFGFCEMHVLVIANFGDGGNVSSSCMVYKYASSPNLVTGNVGVFVEIQSLPGVGISGVITFSIRDDQFLAIAAHGKQMEAPWSNEYNASYFKQGSALYKWNPREEIYELHQSLDDLYSVSLSDSTSVLRVQATIAASDFGFFEWDGDQYLVIAQCLCDIARPTGACLSRSDQPKSAVIQWNPVNRMFGELLSLTNSTSFALRQDPVPDAEAMVRSQALRLISAGAVRVDAANIGSKLILVMTTRQSGAIFYDFSFESVTGLTGPVSVVASPGPNPTGYVISPQDSTLAIIQMVSSADSVGNEILLTYKQTFKDTDGISSLSNLHQNIIGLGGARHVKLRDLRVVVQAGLPPDEMRCTGHPIWATSEDVFTVAGTSALPCQDVTFSISNLTSNNPNLFASHPRISNDGTLHFESAPNQYGFSTFSVQLHDDGLYRDWVMYADPLNYPPGDPEELSLFGRLNGGVDTSIPIQFAIEIVPVNDAPTFEPIVIKLVQNSGVDQSAIFAHELSPGAENERASPSFVFTYEWYWSVTSKYACAERVKMERTLTNTAFNRFTFSDLFEAVQECQKICDSTLGCNFVSFTTDYNPCYISPTCDFEKREGSKVYKNPRVNFERQPVLSMGEDQDTGNAVGVAQFGIKPQARGVVQMRVFAIDTGESNVFTGSNSRSAPITVDFDIVQRNVAPRFEMSTKITVNASSGSHTELHFIKGVNAGDGECFCGALKNCLPGEDLICQSVSFELYQVKTLEGARPNSIDLFRKFEVLGDFTSNSRNFSFTLADHWSGRFTVFVVGKDDSEEKHGKDLNGGEGRRAQSFELEVVSVNEKPSFQKLEELVVSEEQRGHNISQTHAYFTKVRSGSGDATLDLLYQTSFTILKINCTNPSYPEFTCDELFDVTPKIDSYGFVSFVLKPFIFGFVRAEVLPKNSGPEPFPGFEAVEMLINIVDLNTPPTCNYPDQVILVENRGSSSLHNFSVNISSGPEHERWQHVIHEVEMNIFAPDLFSSLPVVDGEGTFIFETAADSFGDALMTVKCRDNGGVSFGGNDTGVHQTVSLKVFPHPRIFSVSPGIGSVSGTSSVTLIGQHFGSMTSRGYNADTYDYVQVLIGGIPCGSTKYISDGRLICVAAPVGTGVEDIAVVVSDPFGSSVMSQNLTRVGQLRQAIAYPHFYVVGSGFIGIGSQHEEQSQPVPTVVKLFNGSTPLPVFPAQEPFCFNAANMTNTSICPNASAIENDMDGIKASHASVASNSTQVPETVRQKFVLHLRNMLECNYIANNSTVILGLNFTEVQMFCNASRDGAVSVDALCRTIYILNSTAMQLSIENMTYQKLKKACLGPGPVPSVPNIASVPFVRAPARIDSFATGFLGAVRASVGADHELFVGGSFIGTDNNRLSNIGRWSNVRKNGGGTSFEPCGAGLDGAVTALERYQGTIVMGGTFSRAALDGGSILHSGGLIAWDLGLSDWVLVGRTPILGTVSAIVRTVESLYVGGRFRSVGGLEVNNIALHSGQLSDPGGWSIVGGGVQGGHVSAMTGFGHELYIGGSFVSYAFY